MEYGDEKKDSRKGSQDLFDFLFNDLSVLKEAAVHGQLENTNLRTLSWMIFLGCLPANRSLWKECLLQNRMFYENMKADKRSYQDFRGISNNSIEQENHPLSFNPNSKWSKYFFVEERKKLIYQDVKRM
jgi:hypothetical protein